MEFPQLLNKINLESVMSLNPSMGCEESMDPVCIMFRIHNDNNVDVPMVLLLFSLIFDDHVAQDYTYCQDLP